MFETRKILCYVSAGEGYSDSIHRAARLAAQAQASLTLLGVVEPIARLLAPFLGGASRLETLLSSQLGAELDELVGQLREQGLQVATVLRLGQPAEQIAAEVLENGHDLVVKLASGQDGRMLGDTARRLVRSCPCPVWIVKPGPRERRRVAAAVDPVAAEGEGDRELQERILARARQAADCLDAHLDVVHAWDLLASHLIAGRMQPEAFAALSESVRGDARARLEALAAQVPGARDDETLTLLEGHHGPALLTFLREQRIDLLVMGTVSRSGLAGMVIGNTAERVLAQLDCSVLVLKPRSIAAERAAGAPPTE